MDIVLEIFDTFLFDRLYAKYLPATSSTILAHDAVNNATVAFSSMPQAPIRFPAASRFLRLEPSAWAYMSSWTRDSVSRQTLSLYLIIW